ncbi:MAG: ComF family protein [Burkholderiales bacterium]|nr:ComF family protein [Burkholderiales bacterium]
MRLFSFFNNWLLKLILQDQYCILCATQTKNQQICHDCNTSLGYQTPSPNTCWRCLAHKSPAQLICDNCHDNQFHFERIITAFNYEFPLEQILHQLKYHGKIEYTNLLSQLFWSRISQQIQSLPDVIIPVPLHVNKLKIRGFNQSYELLHEFKQLNSKTLIIDAKRIKNTKSQANLSRDARMHNIKDAFVINDNLQGKYVVIIDDVVTTGSTVSELSRICKLQGADKVEVWCLMRAL